MEAALHRFVRLLRLRGVRVSVAEVIDGLRAAAQPGVLADREVLRSALAVSMVKDRRDLAAFDEVFDRFFGLRAVVEDQHHGHSHEHDDLTDEGELTDFTLSDDPGDQPQQGHSHGKPVDLHSFFRREDMATQYNLHQEADRLDMANLTDEIVLSDQATGADDLARVQLSASRIHNPGVPGDIARNPGLQLDAELSVAQEMALLAWLGEDTEDSGDEEAEDDPDPSLAALRESLRPWLEGLPERLKDHLEKLLAADHELELRELEAAQAETVDEQDRAALEETLRRLLRSLHGAPRPKRRVSGKGTVDARLTMRTNLKYDGVPFRPVTVTKVEDRPHLLVLCDVSLSVRQTSRFTLHLVHSLQSVAPRVRTFAFVKDLVEITDLFAEHPISEALSLVMSGLPEGGVLDVDADSDYGSAFAEFAERFGSALTRRTTVIVLGDGRGNGNDPRTEVFEEIARRVRSVVWLTPEPRYSWGLGSCDLPLYAEHCDKVQVVRSLTGLEHTTVSLGTA
ncbi:VWA domain-containing protein [Nocardioides panacisoli]|uniref:VWA domain-containing protein n=1 Tax=Nocardioides panacisoli TaxID=627624 RepID=UPI001C639779|nr:VWA domain-containing protein [Nocardioides panacisoli]QYJ02629.1 VWA domain-containing protein [Nocardioides panacisoli]